MENKNHEICFRNVENSWDSALPVGNGRLGAMVFFEERTLHLALNHYDCYYRVLPKLKGEAEKTAEQEKHNGAEQGQEGAEQESTAQAGADATFQDPARFRETYEELCRRVDKAQAAGDTAYRHYARTLHPVAEVTRPSYKGASYPPGGEFLLGLDERVNTADSCLKLLIEEARIVFEAGQGSSRVKAEIIAAREPDGVLLWLWQSEEGLWKDGSWMSEGDSTDAQSCSYRCGQADGFQTIALSLQPGRDRAARAAEELLQREQEIRQEHQAYWKQFWRSSVILPDKFLERLWHMQLYLLECSGAKGSSYPEQSWGLSGLWDIRRPNMWGSMWYWDVNIQSAFWGTYSAGHPELLKLFCEGYLAYEEDIRAYTKQVYGKSGWALDYPHTLYHCIQPWCAQFLWLYYQYTGDLAFLREKAYPVFCAQIDFFKELAKRDAQGTWHIAYDISPEQGPVTEDSVITVACVKKLLKMAAEAARILERPKEEWEEFADILLHLPAYPKTEDGARFKDSYLAQDNLFLRHPSMLMPLFSAEEVAEEVQEERSLWENTLCYAARHTETGTFGMGWLAAAAAKLGLGRDALKLLYEKGIDYVIHENGLAYEESKGFLNYCHLTKPAHFLPVMMEAAGGIVNAVNLMLLQNTADGVLKLFPAVPDRKRKGLCLRKVQYEEDFRREEDDYADWEDVSFQGLMAPGGFVVSAQRRNARVTFVKIESTREVVLKLLLPGELSGDSKCRVVEKQMQPGEILCFGEETQQEGMERNAKEQQAVRELYVGHKELEVLCHNAAETHRRIFLGADSHTKYFQSVDAFTCPYLFGNELQYKMTPWVFDFGQKENGECFKDYNNAYPIQTIYSGQCLLYCGGPRQVGAELYSLEKRYGFLSTAEIHERERSGPDDLRKGFLEGSGEAVFALNLPKGKYDLLIISGDAQEASHSEFALVNQGTKTDTGVLLPGRFSCRILPAVQEKDGELLLRITAKEGYRWKLNAVFVNKEYSL